MSEILLGRVAEVYISVLRRMERGREYTNTGTERGRKACCEMDLDNGTACVRATRHYDVIRRAIIM